MEEVGISLQEDILAYDLIHRLPSSLKNIKKAITHARDITKIKPSTVLNHIKIHLNEQKVTSKNETVSATMFTKEETCCKTGHQNPHSKNHTKENCWMIYP